jgi:hypothetical protein
LLPGKEDFVKYLFGFFPDETLKPEPKEKISLV